MVNEKEINFFKNNGYLIKKSPHQISLNKLQDFVYSIMGFEYSNPSYEFLENSTINIVPSNNNNYTNFTIVRDF